MPPFTVHIDSGTLEIDVRHSLFPLQELCGFACRRNRKRSFLFVSKVLGKHYPAKPSRMRQIYRLLAEQAGELPEPTLVVGMAETATSLGHGIYESYCEKFGGNRLFIHTTRYRSARQKALHFEEKHSHAVDQLLYYPEDAYSYDMFITARSIIVADDEISTGKTLCNLLSAYGRVNSGIEEIRIASITDWLSSQRQQEITTRFKPAGVKFVNILQGNFSFQCSPSFEDYDEVNVTGNGECKDRFLPVNFGRSGVREMQRFDYDMLCTGFSLSHDQKILVAGTGEFMYPPFLLAEWLENKGYDVWFQSTTRSPIMTGGDITSSIRTVDNYWDEIPNFLYNVRPGQYDRVIACYETTPLPPHHDLPMQLNATVLEFV
ncbi:MAG: phosphoribosyltransferase domain-containing protein [Candidatus Xenobiia bacterium LiM19]